ncbi:MAG: hypothetical protein VX679_02020 [Pseudomonadota bacterium]|nr:hypothetical protein [Pseudomonadota bacterium]
MKSRLKKLWGLLVGLEFKHISVIFLGLCILFSGGVYEGISDAGVYGTRLNKFTGTVEVVMLDITGIRKD